MYIHPPEGVKDVVEKQVVEIIENVGTLYTDNEKLPIDRYKLDTSPYEVEIVRGETFVEDSQYGSGFGDLWGYTYFSSFNREESERWYEKELERVSKKYSKEL